MNDGHIYIVWCEYYQEPSINKIYNSKEKAEKYAEDKNKKWDSERAWYVTEEAIYD